MAYKLRVVYKSLIQCYFNSGFQLLKGCIGRALLVRQELSRFRFVGIGLDKGTLGF